MTTQTVGRPDLLQEQYVDDPWKLLVACALMNRTHGNQVRKMIGRLFDLHPTPEALANADPVELETLLRPLGFARQRAQRLRGLARDWILLLDELDSGPVDVDALSRRLHELHGVGRYAVDSYRIFVLDDITVNPDDRQLKRYVLWRRRQL